MARCGVTILLSRSIQRIVLNEQLLPVNFRLIKPITVNQRLVIRKQRSRHRFTMYLGSKLHGDCFDFCYGCFWFTRYIYDVLNIHIIDSKTIDSSEYSCEIYHPDFLLRSGGRHRPEYIYKSFVLTKDPESGVWLIMKLPLKTPICIIDLDRNEEDCLQHHGLALHIFKTLADAGVYTDYKDLIFDFTNPEVVQKQIQIAVNRKKTRSNIDGSSWFYDELVNAFAVASQSQTTQEMEPSTDQIVENNLSS